MNILVTGGAGFIGSHLIERLLGMGESVVCLDNFDDYYDPMIKRENLSVALRDDRFCLVEGDVRDAKVLDRCFRQQRFDIVLHLAARAGVRPSLVNPEVYYDVNVLGTLRLLEAMKQNGVSRMVYTSSSSVYGDQSRVPFSELDPVGTPISPYAASKRAAELLCYTYYHLYKMDMFCLRLFTVYGPRQRPEMAIRMFVTNISEGRPVILYGDGSSSRDYTYVDDIVAGIVRSAALVKGYEILNIGGSMPVTLSSLITVIESVTGRKAIIERKPMQAGDVSSTYADISRAREVLGYNPCFPIERGIRNYVEWLRRLEVSAAG